MYVSDLVSGSMFLYRAGSCGGSIRWWWWDVVIGRRSQGWWSLLDTTLSSLDGWVDRYIGGRGGVRCAVCLNLLMDS